MEEKNIFKNSHDAVLLTCSVLKRLKSGEIDSFNQRLKSQKVHYFSQLFGVSPSYSFNLYLRGPYSPDLAHDLFKIKNKGIRVRVSKFVPEELEKRFVNLEKFIAKKNNRQLEIVATLHWLIKIAKFSEFEAKKKLIELKEVSYDEVKYAFNSIKNL